MPSRSPSVSRASTGSISEPTLATALLIGYQAVLATYGYTGDPDAWPRVVLPLASYDISAGFGLTGPLWEAQHGGQDFGAYVRRSDSSRWPTARSPRWPTPAPTACARSSTLADGTEVWYCHQAERLGG